MYDKAKLIVDRREMLRVKLASLVAESRIIRREERRTHGALRFELQLHRTGVVRREARLTGLALGLIRGRTLLQMEPKSDTKPDRDRVVVMVKKYGPPGCKLSEDWVFTPVPILKAA